MDSSKIQEVMRIKHARARVVLRWITSWEEGHHKFLKQSFKPANLVHQQSPSLLGSWSLCFLMCLNQLSAIIDLAIPIRIRGYPRIIRKFTYMNINFFYSKNYG